MLIETMNLIKQGVVYGFAGYGAGIVYDVNPRFVAKFAAIYAIGANVLLLAAREYDPLNSYRNVNNISLGCDAVLIVAARSFNLIGNRGVALLSAFALLRYTFMYYKI